MAVNGHSNSALCSVDDFVSQDYDYVIVGGGTAGLCVAARLTENPDVKVGVVEAGADRMDDPQVYTPSLYPTLIGREKYDWCFQSIPQPAAANKSYSMPRGKLLGGSSGINYLMQVKKDLWPSAVCANKVIPGTFVEARKTTMAGPLSAMKDGTSTACYPILRSINALMSVRRSRRISNSCPSG